jgi:hypothetical protein
MKCQECNQEIKSQVSYNEWLKVMHYIEIELLQGDITQQTYEALESAMLYLKPEEQFIHCEKGESKDG